MKSERVTTTLGNLLSLSNGKSSPERSNDLPYPVYGGNGVIGFSDQANSNPGTIIIGRVGSYCGSVHFSDSSCWVTDNAIRAKAMNGNDARFLFYMLHTLRLNDFRVGSGQPLLNQTILSQIPATIPGPSEQRRIAHILGTLDDKIELNRQMNETLETTARAIFKSWFVDFDPVKAKVEGRKPIGMDTKTAVLFPSTFQDSSFGRIPEGWEVTRFTDLTDVVLGGDWGKSTEIGDWSCPVFCIRGADIPSLQIGGLGDMPIRYLKTSSLAKRQLQNGDLVIEISGGSPTQSTGRTILLKKELLDQLEFPLVYSNFCRVIRLRSENMSNFIYLWFRDLYSNDKFFQYENGTTGIKNFAFKVFAQEQRLLVPAASIINAFNRTVEPLFKMLQFNGEQSRTLAQTRDALLPKLLSGEIRVDDAKEILE